MVALPDPKGKQPCVYSLWNIFRGMDHVLLWIQMKQATVLVTVNTGFLMVVFVLSSNTGLTV